MKSNSKRQLRLAIITALAVGGMGSSSTFAADDTDNLAVSFGVGLGASYVQEHAGRPGLDVGKSQGG